MILPRIEILNRAVGEAAERHGATWSTCGTTRSSSTLCCGASTGCTWPPVGHRRVAAHVLTALGVKPDAAWLDSPGAPERRPWFAARAHDARWARRYLAPWVKRRLTGRSSGDTVSAKHPVLVPWD